MYAWFAKAATTLSQYRIVRSALEFGYLYYRGLEDKADVQCSQEQPIAHTIRCPSLYAEKLLLNRN